MQRDLSGKSTDVASVPLRSPNPLIQEKEHLLKMERGSIKMNCYIAVAAVKNSNFRAQHRGRDLELLYIKLSLLGHIFL